MLKPWVFFGKAKAAGDATSAAVIYGQYELPTRERCGLAESDTRAAAFWS